MPHIACPAAKQAEISFALQPAMSGMVGVSAAEIFQLLVLGLQ